MKEITLTKGKVALVDDADYEWLNQWKWHVLNRYAARRIYPNDGYHGVTIYMHRLIMDPPSGIQVDHINMDRLDNQRANLRLATRSQNQMNSQKGQVGRSGYKGAFQDACGYRWVAAIGINGRPLYLGRFDNRIDAALAYDAAARQYFKEFARPNFMTEPTAEDWAIAAIDKLNAEHHYKHYCSTIRKRIARGWSEEKAVSVPIRAYTPRR